MSLDLSMIDYPSEEYRFFSKVNFLTESGCWQWLGKPALGYGRFTVGSRQLLAHRAAHEFMGIPLNPKLVLDHLCRNRSCVYPGHLEQVTNRVNVLRGDGPHAMNARVLKCQQGHEYDSDNTYVTPSGSRDCKRCKLERNRAWQKRQKEMVK